MITIVDSYNTASTSSLWGLTAITMTMEATIMLMDSLVAAKMKLRCPSTWGFTNKNRWQLERAE